MSPFRAAFSCSIALCLAPVSAAAATVSFSETQYYSSPNLQNGSGVIHVDGFKRVYDLNSVEIYFGLNVPFTFTSTLPPNQLGHFSLLIDASGAFSDGTTLVYNPLLPGAYHTVEGKVEGHGGGPISHAFAADPSFFKTNSPIAFSFENSAEFFLGPDASGLESSQNVLLSITYHWSRDSAIPEPKVWSILLLGFALAGSMLRLRQRVLVVASDGHG